ncbi:MAG: hypothetical protein H5T95_07265 [Firmicutes bacterium]|nr:hypothetical protein [Bacillota bacterium]
MGDAGWSRGVEAASCGAAVQSRLITRLVAVKRLIAIVGLLCFLEVTAFALFFEPIMRQLPIPSANLCAYRVAALLRGRVGPDDINREISSWRKICPDILAVVVADLRGEVMFSSEPGVVGSKIPQQHLADAGKLKDWLMDNARGIAIKKDAMYQFAYQDAAWIDGSAVRVWAIATFRMYNNLAAYVVWAVARPNSRYMLWTIIWWLSVPTWVYMDQVVTTRSKSTGATMWAAVGFAFNGIGLLLYVAASRVASAKRGTCQTD